MSMSILSITVYARVRARVCVCVRACVLACVRARVCVSVCVCVCVCGGAGGGGETGIHREPGWFLLSTTDSAILASSLYTLRTSWT